MSALKLAPGPVVLDVVGQALSEDDRRRLTHPLVGGVILFARNYATPEQIAALTAEIRALRIPRLLISVDHEGGRVQRFRQGGYTVLPPMASLGRLWDRDRQQALAAARGAGVLIGSELAASGVDLSFTPVLDLAYGHSTVIGDRAFHHDPDAVAQLAGALMQGLKAQGMGAVGKHFPGHGHVLADSHLEVPVDERSFAAIDAADLMPYRRLIPLGLDAVMPAHVIYPAVDARPAGFSPAWLQQVLRGTLQFRGVIFSDDLSMEAASVAGGIVERATAALQAGCDLVLACNRPDAADELLAKLHWEPPAGWAARVKRLRCTAAARQLRELPSDPAWQMARDNLATLLA
jgi:beta-N-acetylhexosaminidase